MNAETSFMGIDPNIRTRIYDYLITTTPARLPWRPAIRYASFGFPVEVILLNQTIAAEATEFIVSINSFNIVVGHRIVPDTVISPLPYGHFPVPPNFTWIQRLILTLEIDLDNLFISDHPDELLPVPPGETIFHRTQTLQGLITTMSMPNLKYIGLSIYEIIHPKDRIHITCTIDEQEVRKRYKKMIKPLSKLDLPEGLILIDIDIVYGDGYTLEGADPGDWRRADDYIWLFEDVLTTKFGCIRPTGREAALEALQRNSIDGRLDARQVFGYMTPTNPLEEPPLLPPVNEASEPENTLSPRGRGKTAGTLRRYWNEGTRYLVESRKESKERRILQSPQSSSSISSASPVPQQQNTAAEGRSSSGRSSLGKYWNEGATYTFQSFRNLSRGKGGPSGSKRDGKGHRWSSSF